MYWDRFDIVEAYFLFFSHYHEGMNSRKYLRLSRMLRYFKPSPIMTYESLSENGQAIYDNLENNEIKEII